MSEEEKAAMEAEDAAIAERELESIKEAVRKLSPKFDSVQIFATRHISDEFGTRSLCWGAGNVYAREAQVRGWLEQKDEYERMKARGDEESDDE